MEKNKNRKLFKIIIIIVDIIVIIGLFVIARNWIYNNKKQEINFKNFTFYVSKEIHYEKIYENAFILETDDYLANIIVYSDKENNVFNEIDRFKKWLLAKGIIADQCREEKILGKDVLIFTNYNGNSNTEVYYFRTQDLYLAEVKLTIKSNEFNSNETLTQIVDIFNNAKYDDSTGYIYLIHDFAIDDQEYFEDLKEVSK